MAYYQRTVYCSNKLIKPIWYKDKMQILPFNNRTIIEYDYDFFLKSHSRPYDENSLIVDVVLNDVFSREILHLLTLVSNDVFLIRSFDTPRNTFPESSKEIDSLTNSSLNLQSDTSKDKILEFHPEIDRLFTKIFNLDIEKLPVIKSAMHWYYSARLLEKEADNYNGELIFFVNSIEALCKLEFSDKPQNCPECGQTRHKATKKFVDFLLKYSGDPRSRREQKKLYSNIYNKRSVLIHNAELIIPVIELFINRTMLEDIILLDEIRKLSRNAILNFILYAE